MGGNRKLLLCGGVSLHTGIAQYIAHYFMHTAYEYESICAHGACYYNCITTSTYHRERTLGH